MLINSIFVNDERNFRGEFRNTSEQMRLNERREQIELDGAPKRFCLVGVELHILLIKKALRMRSIKLPGGNFTMSIACIYLVSCLLPRQSCGFVIVSRSQVYQFSDRL